MPDNKPEINADGIIDLPETEAEKHGANLSGAGAGKLADKIPTPEAGDMDAPGAMEPHERLRASKDDVS